MSNISITQCCNRGCAYCFAEDVMKASGARSLMTWEEFSASLDFLEKSGVCEATLLGGEPTIHPRFREMVGYALGRGFSVLVLTGGIIPEMSLQYLELASADRVGVMLNVVPPGDESNQHEQVKQADVLRRLNKKVALGLNIDSPNTPLDFLLEWIEQYGLDRVVRLGLAHPIADGHNAYLPARDYPAVGRRVAGFARHARKQGVHIEYDCGWVPCMFPPEALAELEITPQQVGLRCNPIVDILPGGQAISCYPLASIAREAIEHHRDGSALADHFTRQIAPFRPMKLYKHCDSCQWLRRGECTGGCVAGSMKRLRSINTEPVCA